MLQSEIQNTVVPSIIGEDLTVTGNIISKGEVQIEGELQGDVFCSLLTIGEKGRISGSIVAEEVIVYGRVNGSIHAVRVTLESTCHVEGDICHKMLKLEHGGYFDGGSRRADDPIAVAANNEDSLTQAIPSSPARPRPVNLTEAA